MNFGKCKCCGGDDAEFSCALCDGEMCKDCTRYHQFNDKEAEQPYCEDCNDNGTFDEWLSENDPEDGNEYKELLPIDTD